MARDAPCRVGSCHVRGRRALQGMPPASRRFAPRPGSPRAPPCRFVSVWILFRVGSSGFVSVRVASDCCFVFRRLPDGGLREGGFGDLIENRSFWGFWAAPGGPETVKR